LTVVVVPATLWVSRSRSALVMTWNAPGPAPVPDPGERKGLFLVMVSSDVGRMSRSCLNCELRRDRYFCSTRLWRLREWQWSSFCSGVRFASGLVDGDGMSVRCFPLALGVFGGWGSARLRFVLHASSSGPCCRFLGRVLLAFASLVSCPMPSSGPLRSPLQRSMMFRHPCLVPDSADIDAAGVLRVWNDAVLYVPYSGLEAPLNCLLSSA
jgi:hypothetical protein